jgi:hypothetical protein
LCLTDRPITVDLGRMTVPDLAFYNAGCHEPKGVRRVVVPFRRLLRRLLRPIFQRQMELFQHLGGRLDEHERSIQANRTSLEHLSSRHEHLADQMQVALAFGWDYVALVRRLAVLEDRVEELMREREGRADENGSATSEPRARVA